MLAKNNPFRTERVLKIRYELQQDSWEALLARIEAAQYVGALVGHHGSGKTTLLEDLVPRLESKGHKVKMLFRNDTLNALSGDAYKTFFKQVTPDHIILFDGASLMNRREWLRFKKDTEIFRGLIITAHDEKKLPALIQCDTDIVLLTSIISTLLEGCSLPKGCVIEALYQKHHKNIRDVLRELYDIYAQDKIIFS